MKAQLMGTARVDAQPLMVDVLNRHQQAWPVDLEGIAQDFGIAVRRDPTMPDDISGKIVRDRVRGGPSGYSIVVNGRHHENRQRFTLAHELAHFMLHRDLIGDGIVDNAMYRSGTINDHMERMADRQAAEMILPAPLVRQAFREVTKSPHLLARKFKVSEAAMRIRLKELRLGA